MGPKVCPEMSVTNYHYSLRNNPEERSSHPGCHFRDCYMTTTCGYESYSSCSSDGEESSDSFASKCLLLQELPEWQYQEYSVSVDIRNFGEYHHQYKSYPSWFVKVWEWKLKPCWNKQDFFRQLIFHCKAQSSFLSLSLTNTLQDSLDEWSACPKACA